MNTLQSMNHHQYILQVKNLQTYFFDEASQRVIRAVDGVSFEIAPGQTLGLVGESGSGKSVTAQSILGLVYGNPGIVGGEIFFQKNGIRRNLLDGLKNCVERKNGTLTKDMRQWLDAQHKNLTRIRGKEIAYIFQDYASALDPGMTVKEQLTETLQHHEKTTTAMEWLEKVKLPEEYLEKYPYELNGGAAQRVMIALALCTDPVLLISDEATTNLDAVTERAILKLLEDLQKENGMSILLISHNREIVKKHADEFAEMSKGQIIRTGRSEALDTSPFPAKKNGRQFSGADAHLEVSDLRVYFQKRQGNEAERAVDGVSFSIRKGEIFGLIGETGCGKTTIGRAILRLIAPAEIEKLSGSVQFQDKEILKLPENKLRPLRHAIQMIFQDPGASLNQNMKVEALLEEAAGLYAHEFRQWPKEKQHAHLVRLLDEVGLNQGFMSKYPFELSGGQKRRVGLARIRAVQPKFIVADEPISELDFNTQQGILKLLQEINRKGTTFLFISHDLRMIKNLCHHVAVMYQGKIVEIGTKDDIFERPKHPYTNILRNILLDEDGDKDRDLPPKTRENLTGCPFQDRCYKFNQILTDEQRAKCRSEECNQEFEEKLKSHRAACHYPEN